jgi:hypothetical protein
MNAQFQKACAALAVFTTSGEVRMQAQMPVSQPPAVRTAAPVETYSILTGPASSSTNAAAACCLERSVFYLRHRMRAASRAGSCTTGIVP